MFADVTCESAVEALRRDGLFTGINLPKQVCEDIAGFAAGNRCFAGDNRKIEFLPDEHGATEQRLNQAILNGNYFEKSLECDAVHAVMDDALLKDIAANYLGGEARLCGTRIFWTFPTKRVSEVPTSIASKDEYHFDLFDWRMLKFFFYLRPVDEGGGPHIYVRGSHRHRALRHQFTPFVGHPIDEVLRVYGADKSVTSTRRCRLWFCRRSLRFPYGDSCGEALRAS